MRRNLSFSIRIRNRRFEVCDIAGLADIVFLIGLIAVAVECAVLRRDIVGVRDTTGIGYSFKR